jgi:PAS domain S-box-containing protein
MKAEAEASQAKAEVANAARGLTASDSALGFAGALLTGEEKIRVQALLLDSVQEAVIATDLDGRVIFWNRFAEALYGWTADEAIGRTVLDLNVAPGTREDAETLMRKLRAGESWSGEFVLQRRNGTTFPAHVSDSPVHDPSGTLIGIVGISYDITPAKQAAEKQALLVRELHHRVKNTLATVQAIMGATARTATSVEEFQSSFQARIASLAKTHSMLANDDWQTVTFRQLLSAELEPYDDGTGKRLRLSGPAVVMPSDVAVPLGMAVHELTTNAAKYGALSELGASIHVNWELIDADGAEKLRWEWTERDGPRVDAPTREGFGSRLLRRVLTAQIGAQVDVDFAPEGLRVTAIVPLTAST